MDFIKAAIKQPITVVVGVLFVIMSGLIALKAVPVQMTPDVEDTIIAVTTSWENASPQEIESEVVDPQEEKLQGLSNLKNISSVSSRGNGVIRLEFANGVDKDVALREVSDKLREVKSYPENVDEPVIEATDPESKDYIAWFVLTTTDKNFDIRKFYDTAEDRMKPILERVPGISEVNILGGLEREVQVQFDALRLAQYKLTIIDLYDGIRSANVNFSGGALVQGKTDIRIRAVGRFTSVDQVENYVIQNGPNGPVYVRDVAKVVETFKEPTSFVRVKGVTCLAINFQKEPGGNVLEIIASLEETVKGFHGPGKLLDVEAKKLGLDGELSMRISYDSTLYVNQALKLVTDNLYVGSFLAIIVLLAFLRSIRSVGIIALAIPVSMIGTIVFMVLLGRTINVISLAGLAFAVGMVVDNSIVVLENIYRHLEMGKKRGVAAYDGTREVAGAVLASTLTTVVVFLPILLIQDQVGQLFRDIAIAIMISVTLSYVVSITLIPSAAALLLKAGKKKMEENSKVPLIQRFVFAINGNNFSRMFITVGFVVLTLWGTIKLMPPLDYLPAGNRNITFGVMITPPGYSIDQLEKLGLRLEETVKPFWENREDRPSFPDPYDPQGGMIQPAPIEEYFVVGNGGTLFHGAISADSKKAADTVILFDGATSQERMPGVYGFAFQFPLFRLGGTTGSAVKMNLTGSNLEEVANAAGAIFGTIMQKQMGSVRPDPANFNVKAPELQIIPDSLQLAESRLTQRDLGLTVAANSDGLFSGEYDLNGDLVDLKLIAQNSNSSKHIQSLATTPVATPSGKVISLDKIGRFNWVEAPEQIKRVGRERAVTLEFTAPKGMPLEDVVKSLEGLISDMRQNGGIAPGVSVDLEGTAGKLKEIKNILMGDGTLASILGSSLFLAAAAVYLLMCVLFQSWIQPLIIMFTVPLATFGGFVGLALVHNISLGDRYMPVQNMDVLTILGFIILAGVVVNNAILIVAQTNNLMKGVDDSGNEIDALPAREAIAEAVQSRVRPIFMSMLTSVGGMLPLVLTPGSGSELYRGLGAVIVGGMLFSTLFTLLLVPVLLSLVFSVSNFFKKEKTGQLVVVSLLFFIISCAGQSEKPELTKNVIVPVEWTVAKLPEVEGSLEQWWNSFDDEILVELIDRARKNNPDVTIALQAYLQSLAIVSRKEADFTPETIANGSVSRSQYSENLKNNFQSADAVTDIRAGLSSSWELDFFGRIEDAVRAAEFDSFIKAEDLGEIHALISAQLADSYFTYRSLDRQIEIAESNIALQQENVDFVQARIEAGKATELEESEAQALLSSNKANLEELKARIKVSLNALSLLVGANPNTITEELLEKKNLPVAGAMLKVGVPADVIRHRPDIRKAEYAVVAEASRLMIAEKEYLPKFRLNGSIGLNSTYLKDLLKSGSETYSFGPSFEWRVFDFGRVNSEIRQQQAVLESRVASYRKVVLKSFQEVEDSLASYQFQKQREVHLQAALESVEKSVNLSKVLYTEGVRDYQTVMSSLIAKQRAEQNLVMSQELSVRYLVSLYKALGGGR